MSLTTQTDGDREELSKAGQSRLTTKPTRHSASCRVPIFLVEKSADMRYNKLLNFAGVMERIQQTSKKDILCFILIIIYP